MCEQTDTVKPAVKEHLGEEPVICFFFKQVVYISVGILYLCHLDTENMVFHPGSFITGGLKQMYYIFFHTKVSVFIFNE